MTRFYLLILFSIACLPSFAQTDIESLHGLSPDAVISRLGKPDKYNEEWMLIDGKKCLASASFIYGKTSFSICTASTVEDNKEDYFIDYFLSEDSGYCILTDVIEGGIKAGDKFLKLKDIDFVNTERGKGKPENAMKKPDYPMSMTDWDGSDPEVSYYILYEKEYFSFFFLVKNGIIKAISMVAKEDWNPEYE